ncbi:Small heat shock protein, chloroplastic (Fragment) [Linum perenne]
MGKSDVKVWVEDNMLVLKGGAAAADAAAGNEEWLSKSYGKYSYRIALPDNIEFEKIKAEVKDGVLYVTIPKAHTTCKVLDIDIE